MTVEGFGFVYFQIVCENIRKANKCNVQGAEK